MSKFKKYLVVKECFLAKISSHGIPGKDITLEINDPDTKWHLDNGFIKEVDIESLPTPYKTTKKSVKKKTKSKK